MSVPPDLLLSFTIYSLIYIYSWFDVRKSVVDALEDQQRFASITSCEQAAAPLTGVNLTMALFSGTVKALFVAFGIHIMMVCLDYISLSIMPINLPEVKNKATDYRFPYTDLDMQPPESRTVGYRLTSDIDSMIDGMKSPQKGGGFRDFQFDANGEKAKVIKDGRKTISQHLLDSLNDTLVGDEPAILNDTKDMVDSMQGMFTTVAVHLQFAVIALLVCACFTFFYEKSIMPFIQCDKHMLKVQGNIICIVNLVVYLGVVSYFFIFRSLKS